MPTRRTRAPTLTHVDAARRPTMVDVGPKAITLREACAEAVVTLPRVVSLALRRNGQRTKKGAGIDAASGAGDEGGRLVCS